MNLKSLISVPDCAAEVGVTRAAVTKACRAGRLEGAQLMAGVWLIPKRAAAAWKRSRKAGA